MSTGITPKAPDKDVTDAFPYNHYAQLKHLAGILELCMVLMEWYKDHFGEINK